MNCGSSVSREQLIHRSTLFKIYLFNFVLKDDFDGALRTSMGNIFHSLAPR